MQGAARLRGHGLVVTPRAPFVLRRIGDGADDRVAIQHAGEALTLDPAAPADPALEAVAEILLAEHGPADGWVVEFGPYAVRWPNHHAVGSSDLDGVPFELWGPDGASLFVQGPFDPPPTEAQMLAPDQPVADRGDAGGAHWFELAYEAPGGIAWRQRHHVLPNGLVVSAQAPLDVAAAAMAVAGGVVGELLDHCDCTRDPTRRSATLGRTPKGQGVWRCPTCGAYWLGAEPDRARRVSPQVAAAELGLIG